MPVPIQRPTGAKPWGLLGYLKDFISPPGYVSRGPLGSRPAAAATLDRAPTDAELRAEGYRPLSGEFSSAGRSSKDRAPTDAELRAEGYRPLSGEFSLAGRAQPNAIVTGLTPAGEVDRTKSDLYRQYAPKPFPATPEGQFERYFKTPEMDQYFGTASRGKGAPSDVAGMEALAGQLTAPKDTSLASYYRAQSAVGRAQMPEIQKGLGYAEGSDLAKWAAANPMLAQRLYAKKQAAESSQPPATPGYEAGVQPLTEAESFSMAANGVPAPWNTQGEKVSGEFSGVVPFQAAKTTGEGMPAFQTTGEKAAEFLKRPNISALF